MSSHQKIACEKCDVREQGVFCSLRDEELAEFTAHKITNNYKKGQTLFFEGNPPFGIYCLNKGKVKITKASSNGKESIVRIAKAGDILGHRSLFSEELYSATATAIEDSTICFLNKKFILKAIFEKPTMAMNIISRLSQEMGTAETQIASMFQKNVRERLAELLLTLKSTFGQKLEDGRWRLDIKLTREEMSSMIGVASETLIRILSDFKNDDLIEQKGKIIFILNEDALIQVANIDL